MFYSQFILAKKGPLGTIWIAAHLERKLRKNQVADTDIGVSVDSILFPEVPIALRLSSHLLLGVVRIYSRKVNYLFDDCSEALLKIKQAFRSTAVDLPPEESTAPYHSITLPETFDLDDFELPDNEIYQGNYVDHHVSSREQITLQDTMDGVVFANQFGLDERFGDGDASQIGLDLDEELLMDKVKSQVAEEASNFNPQESTLTVTLLELKDGSDEEMLETSQTMVLDFVDQTEVPSANNEFVEYAQAPSTPGLLQEPNLSSVQEAFACDDHLEGEDHNVTEFVVEGGKVSEPRKLDLYGGGDNGSKWSSGVEENGHLSIGTENKRVQSELFLSTVSAVEHMPQDEIGVLDGKALKEREDTRNGDVLSNKSTNIVDQMDVDCGTEDRLDGRLASGFCAVANDVEIHSGCKSSLSSDFVQVPEGSLVDGQASPKIYDIVEDGKILDAVLPQETSLVCEVNNSEFRCDHDPNNDETSVPVIHKEMSSRGKPVLRGCDTVLNQHDTLSFGGEECQATDHMKPSLGRNELSEAALCGEGDCNNSNELNNNATSSEIPSNVKSSTTPELSAPERLLSVPNDFSRPNNPLLDFSTPDKDILHENNDGSDAIKPTSGKKRNFAESTLTVHSFNSTDSVGVARYKRTTEYIPDDDDLLSSILVGRRSSVLKMKPTPPVAETTSMKRSRSVVRASTTKRKVLMDDSMVLHGDIIRQQLMSTEDIRRVRKKAPCTRPEISMIQRQFLEDEIFCDTILSGMSGQLMELQCETLDFSGVRVSEDCQEIASSEVAKYSEPAAMSNIVKESKNEGNIESAIIRNDIEAPPVDISIQTESEHAGELNVESRDFQTPEQETANVDDVLEFQTSLNQLQGEITKVEIERGNVERTNLGTESTISGFGFTSPVVRNNSFDSEGPLLMDTSCFPSEMRLGFEQDIEHVIDASTGDIGQKEGPDIDNLCIKDESRGLFADCFEPTISLKEGDVRYEDTGIDDKDPTSSCMNDEVANIGSPSTVGHYVDDKSVSTFSGVHTDCPENDGPSVADAAVSTVNHSTGEDHENFEDPTAGNDTEFLNVDDDEIAGDEEDEQFAEETCLAENSGWSSRTRAVAKYLQTVFDNEAIQGKKVLAMDNLLVRKSRKEASRMFFETLVLKTRDYVHVEQAKPFDNISIKPRAKLMKSDF